MSNAETPPPAVEPVLRVTDICKEFVVRAGGPFSSATKTLKVIDEISFEIAPAETLAIVGESGCGKSTTARIVAKLLKPTSGRIEVDGADVTAANAKALRKVRRTVQVIFQDPYSSLNPRHNVEEIVSAPLRYQRLPLPSEGISSFVKGLMERVGLNPDHSKRYPAQFSGGQAQRIGIARAIAIGPKVIICDEAVSALDVSVQAQVIDLLKDLQREQAFSYMFITHDLAVVRQLAHRVGVMRAGQLIEVGDRRIFDHPEDEYTRSLLAAVPKLRLDGHDDSTSAQGNHLNH